MEADPAVDLGLLLQPAPIRAEHLLHRSLMLRVMQHGGDVAAADRLGAGAVAADWVVSWPDLSDVGDSRDPGPTEGAGA